MTENEYVLCLNCSEKNNPTLGRCWKCGGLILPQSSTDISEAVPFAAIRKSSQGKARLVGGWAVMFGIMQIPLGILFSISVARDSLLWRLIFMIGYLLAGIGLMKKNKSLADAMLLLVIVCLDHIRFHVCLLKESAWSVDLVGVSGVLLFSMPIIWFCLLGLIDTFLSYTPANKVKKEVLLGFGYWAVMTFIIFKINLFKDHWPS